MASKRLSAIECPAMVFAEISDVREAFIRATGCPLPSLSRQDL